jgi:hypothetical protein
MKIIEEGWHEIERHLQGMLPESIAFARAMYLTGVREGITIGAGNPKNKLSAIVKYIGNEHGKGMMEGVGDERAN